MEARLGFSAITFLMGYGLIWVGWAATRAPFTRRRIARGLVFLFLGTLVTTLFLETAALAFIDTNWFWCSGGCACPMPPFTPVSFVPEIW